MLLTLIALWGNFTYAQQVDRRLSGMDKEIQDIMQQYQAVGLSVVIVENGRTLYTKGYGYRDLEQKLPVTPQTIFPIGSITKSFTAALIGMMADSGKVAFNEKPSAYLPDFRFSTDQMNLLVSIEDLLTHRSGLGGVDGSFVLFPAASVMELMHRLRYITPESSPKDGWAYSNLGYNILGAIAEQQGHDSWYHLVEQRIFRPLQMVRTSTSTADMIKTGNYSKGYGLANGRIKELLFQEFDGAPAGGAINSTIDDMASWVKLWLDKGNFHGRRLLSEKFVNGATSFKAVVNGAPPDSANPGNFIFGYGYGWNVNSYKGHYRVHHGGAVSGFSANVVMFPKEKIGIVVLSNQHNTALPYNITSMISERMLGLSRGKPYVYSKELYDINMVDETIKPLDQNKKISHDLDAYCGTYVHPGYGKFRIVKENGELYALFPTYKFRLEHQHYDVFMLKLINDIPQQFDPAFTLNFRTNDEGRIAAVDTDFQRAGARFQKE